ncbi:hypothetical protein H112_00700 [Trichophyton rubrum D6]|uniref:Uncharacterized protein n=1 Tax=Trichophyton soudanense CBS 452.61 TaxID=1215331 RepID=A0A022Y706_TRISD|nr:hypothetical protein H105_00692 [Trichophyton soudanense CBS 452.61]KDB38141.1 hypothetical protein H112_00700 [Trichophyton rubrum D6]
MDLSEADDAHSWRQIAFIPYTRTHKVSSEAVSVFKTQDKLKEALEQCKPRVLLVLSLLMDFTPTKPTSLSNHSLLWPFTDRTLRVSRPYISCLNPISWQSLTLVSAEIPYAVQGANPGRHRCSHVQQAKDPDCF